jgi:hypothetical protein
VQEAKRAYHYFEKGQPLSMLYKGEAPPERVNEAINLLACVQGEVEAYEWKQREKHGGKR